MDRSGGYWPAVRSQIKRLVVWLVAAAIVLAAVGLVYFEDPYEAVTGSVEAVSGDVEAVEDDRWVVDRIDDGHALQSAADSPEQDPEGPDERLDVDREADA